MDGSDYLSACEVEHSCLQKCETVGDLGIF